MAQRQQVDRGLHLQIGEGGERRGLHQAVEATPAVERHVIADADSVDAARLDVGKAGA